MLLYIYNLKINDKKVLNNVKRRFYYALNTEFNNKMTRFSKNVLFFDSGDETEIENFFREYSGFMEVYKISPNSIEKLLEVTPL